MALDINEFKSFFSGGGARANLFECEIGWPSGVSNPRTTPYMIKATSLPGSTIATIPIPFQGRNVHVAGDRTFETWSITVLNDNNFEIRNAFEQWMSLINEHEENIGRTNPSDYQAEMTVHQLDKSENRIKTYRFSNCFPINLGAIELSWDSADTIEEFDVEFQYDYWTSDNTSNSSGSAGIGLPDENIIP